MNGIVKNKKHNKLHHWTGFDTVITINAVVVIIITLYPMWYVFCMSISDPKAAASGLVTITPVGFTLDSYKMVFSNTMFWRAILNSVIYVIAGCLLMLFQTIAFAYPLSRPNLKYRKPLTYFLLIQMYFGGGMIPSFILITKLGLYNSPWALILPGYSIWHVILCRTFMASLPNDLIDAAFIDGADSLKALWKIVIPLCKPVLAVILIYTIVGIWNSWFGASIYTTRPEIQPVQLYLRNVLASANSGTRAQIAGQLPRKMQELYAKEAMSARQLKYTMIITVTAPILMVYPMFQKYFTKGLMLGSLKN